MVQTLFMNMFFGGRMKGMPPKLVSDDGRHVVIRPLAYVAEADLVRWAEYRQFPIIPCNLCGSQTHLQRVKVGQMLRDWEREQPGRIDRIFRAMGDIVPSHLMDRNLHPFASLQPTGTVNADGDRAFDEEEFEACGPAAEAQTDRDRARPSPPRAGLAATREIRHDQIDRRSRRRVLALAGCASLNVLDAEVSSFSRWPAGRAPATYAFERLPSQQANPQAAAGARGFGAARGRGRRLRARGRGRGARRQRADRRADHRHRPLALRRPVLVRPLRLGSVPSVVLRPLRPAATGDRIGARTGDPTGATAPGVRATPTSRTTSARSRC